MDAPRIQSGLPQSFEDLATQGIRTQSKTNRLKNCLWNAVEKVGDIAKGIFTFLGNLPLYIAGGALTGFAAWIMFMTGQSMSQGVVDERITLIFLAISVGAGAVMGVALGFVNAVEICKGQQQA